MNYNYAYAPHWHGAVNARHGWAVTLHCNAKQPTARLCMRKMNSLVQTFIFYFIFLNSFGIFPVRNKYVRLYVKLVKFIMVLVFSICGIVVLLWGSIVAIAIFPPNLRPPVLFPPPSYMVSHNVSVYWAYANANGMRRDRERTRT